jgi:predicted dehydrogenase
MPASSTQNTTRRGFLHASLAAGAALASCSGWPVRSSSLLAASPNEQLRIGVIGTGVRGKYLIGNLPESARVVAICDCATSRMAETLEPTGEFTPVLARFRDADAAHCAMHQDYRRLIDRETLDAVIIATPDHHHTLAAMLALRAGLDVYLEKPLTLTIREGRLLSDMVKKTGRVLQVGSQQRTMEMNRFACDFIRNGGLGKISRVDLPNYPGPITIPRMRNDSIPEGLDWDQFLGPAPLRAHARQLWVKDEYKVGDLLWRGWDLYRDYSGHLMTNWGGHSIDMVQYALGRDDTGPVDVCAAELESVSEIAEMYGQRVATLLLAPAELESVSEIAEMWKDKTPWMSGLQPQRFWPVEMRYADGVELQFISDQGDVRFFGERGVLKMRRNHFETDPPDLIKNSPDPQLAGKWKGEGHVARPHLENWLECIRTRAVPNAPVEAGHRTATICHLANIARELNRPLHWNPEEERFLADDAANSLLDRPRRKGFELPA